MTDEERQFYRLHARLPVYARHVAQAQAIVRDALASHPGTWAVAVSGGKDSTAMLQICLLAGWRGPLFHVWYDGYPVENTQQVLDLAARFELQTHTLQVALQFQMFEEIGEAFIFDETVEQAAARRRTMRIYRQTRAREHSLAGFDGCFLGMRAEESRRRRGVIARKGTIYRTQDRTSITALPLARWTARDVWAWHLAHGLPWLARYDRAEDRERERSETSWMTAQESWRRGEGRRIRENDPGLWARLTARWPELARWG